MRKVTGFALCLLLVSAGVVQKANAVVWSAVNNTVVNNNVQNCTACHGAVDNYSTFLTTFASPTAAANRVDAEEMPPGGALGLTPQATIVSWAAQGAPFAAATASTSGITNQQKTSVSLNGIVDTNSGYSGGQWYFEYGLASSPGYNAGQVSATTRNLTNSANVSYSLTGLTCGTSYRYRVVALNGNNTAFGGNSNFSTAACSPPTITQGASINLSTNEDTDDVFVLNYAAGELGTKTWSIFAQGSAGSYSFDSSTTSNPVTVRYTPNANQSGSDTAGRIRVTNAVTNLTDTIILNMSVTAVNDQPVITSIAPASAVEDVLYSYQVVVADPDDAFGAGLSIGLSNAPGDMTVSSTGLITWTPINGVTTSGLVTVTVNDGGENGTVAAVQQFTVAVTGTNDPPVITPGATTTATEDVLYSYQMQVTDVDDANNGTDLSYTLFGQPAGMLVSSTGLITWTPSEGVLTSGQVTIEVEDGNEDGSTPTIANFGQEQFTITVTPVNDSPVVTPGAPVAANEGDNYSYAINVFDPDDVNDGSNLTFTPSNFPTGMTVSSTGVINWLVPRTGADVTFNNITVTVSDGGEDGAVSSAEVFNLAVSIVDDDNDAVANYADNCPGIANGVNEDNQADNDNDTQYIANAGFPVIGDVDTSDPATGGDACDTDDDNDGMLDADELLYPGCLDPFNASDATEDCDGDGINNITEVNDGDPATTPDTDSVGPVVNAPADITMDATGLLTDVNLGTATGSDGNDGVSTIFKAAVNLTQAEKDALAVAVTGCQLFSDFETPGEPFRPGSYVLTWAACDSSGNSGQDDQVVNVKPLLGVSSGQTVGEGQAVSVEVSLNGNAIAYPATVLYTVTGTASALDHDAVDGMLSFTAAGEVATINFNTLADAVSESDETVIFTLHSPTNIALSNARVHSVTITESNVAPQLVLSVSQAVTLGNTVYQPDGLVTVTADAVDVNGDSLSYSWAGSDETLLNAPGTVINSNQLQFDPAALTLNDFYVVQSTVSDADASVSVQRLLQVSAAPVALSAVDSDGDGINDDDVTEGYADNDSDGIPNYLDNLSTPPNAIEDQTLSLQSSLYIETDPGLKIALGETAVAAQSSGVLIGMQDIIDFGGAGGNPVSNAGTEHTFISGLLNFEISGLNDDIESVNVVIPLLSAIQEGAVYRKYTASGWFDFVEDDLNQLRSAPGYGGSCPQPGSNLYTDGLSVGHLCLQLTIQDGGSNDADGLRNFVVKDPGGLALAPEPEEVAVVAEDGSGRAGSLSVWFVLTLAIMLLVSWRLGLLVKLQVNRKRR